ncbi:hypothetical protein ACL02U_07530 [Streptomyces sp. MS06]
MAARRDLAIGLLKHPGADDIAKATRTVREQPGRALPLLDIINNPGTDRT